MIDAFLDTNAILRHLLDDHPEHAALAHERLRQVEAGRLRVRTSDTVVFEAVFTLERVYRVPRPAIADALAPIIELPGIVLPTKRVVLRALDVYREHNLSFADCYHAALMERLGLTDILTFDRGFDRLPWVRRVEP